MIFIFLAKIFSQHSWLIFSVLDFIFFYKINCLASSNVSPQSFRLPYLNSLFLPYVFICFTFLCWYFRCCQNYFGPYFCLLAFLNIFLEWLICFRIDWFIYLLFWCYIFSLFGWELFVAVKLYEVTKYFQSLCQVFHWTMSFQFFSIHSSRTAMERWCHNWIKFCQQL